MAQAEEDYSGKKVVIGLTGRVDSAVAALLLKKQGMDVIGVSIVTCSDDQFEQKSLAPICHVQDLDKVKKVCEKINIPFYATDAKAQFNNDVVDPLVSARLMAQSNNTCFHCTKMRIQILYEKMKKLGADYISTGHYCKVQKNLNSAQYFIHSNNDPQSDQSYLLSDVEGKYLKHLILPLGELRNTEVLKIAQKFSLPVNLEKEEKNFCFTEVDSYIDLAKTRVPKSLMKEGQFQNVYSELYHGDHEGIINYQLGQKELPLKGVNPADGELEIISYDFVTGLIKIGSSDHLTHEGFQMVHLKLGAGLDQTRPLNCFLKSKNLKNPLKAKLFFKNNNTALIECAEQIYPLIKDESFVVFDKDTRNAKVIGMGNVGIVGKFELLDRAYEFRNAESEEEVEKSSKLFKF